MSRDSYYECHVTMVGDKEHIERAVNNIGWSFSAIDKDIILGEGVKCYATKHYNDGKRNATWCVSAVVSAAAALSLQGCKVTRRKVEHVVYDTKLAEAMKRLDTIEGATND